MYAIIRLGMEAVAIPNHCLNKPVLEALNMAIPVDRGYDRKTGKDTWKVPENAALEHKSADIEVLLGQALIFPGQEPAQNPDNPNTPMQELHKAAGLSPSSPTSPPDNIPFG